MTINGTNAQSTPNWRHVGVFLALTFGLTWLLNLAMYANGGLNAPAAITAMQLQMLLPAFSAIVLGMFFFRESQLYHDRSGRGRWFYYYFLLLTVVYALGVLCLWLAPAQDTIMQVVTILPLVLSFAGLVLLIVLRFTMNREARVRSWLSWGRWHYWLVFGLAVVTFYGLQAALNAWFGFCPAHLAPVDAPAGLSSAAFQLLGAVQTVLVGPFLGIVITFGEEYGWRGYLQSELMKLGRVKGVLLVGVIWGVWHWPVILMGYNYPGHPWLGLLLMALFATGFAVVLGYAVLKSGSVLLATYLHALNNQVAAFIVFLGFAPFDSAFSFMIGIYGIATLAIIALLIFRDPVWRGKGSSLA